MVEEANNDQEFNATPAVKRSQQPFIILPFDEGIPLTSSLELSRWIDEEKKRFQIFLTENSVTVTNGGRRKEEEKEEEEENLLQCIQKMIMQYYDWYVRLTDLSISIPCRYDNTKIDTIIDTNILESKENFIRVCKKFSNAGFFPMQSSVGACAIAMSRVQVKLPIDDQQQPPDLPQGIAWLYSMMVRRKQQSKQEIATSDIKISIADGEDRLNTLLKDIEEAQAKISRYKRELEQFQKNALKSAALKSPANALRDLEKAHRNTALGYFGLITAIVSAWIWFVISSYYPSFVKPLLDKAQAAPLEASAMILTSMVFTGIVLTVVIILLRLAVSRINFSIAAGERKAMAAAYRALLDENAIPNDQQFIFLQSIVGGNFPGYVDSNGIPMLQDTLGAAAKNLRGGTTSGR